MIRTAHRFVDGIPAHYDAGLGPNVFVDYATDLARRVAAGRPKRVLELAAGTGIVTRALRDALPSAADVVASDLNPAMLAIARQKFRANEDVEFQAADATALPFDDGTFDAVVCQFGVMFFLDKQRSYDEAARVLTPGGRYHFNVWDSWDENPFARITHETINRFFKHDPPGFYKVPFGYHGIDTIRASLAEAGFDDIWMHVLKIEKTIAQARRFAEGLIFGNPVIDEIRARNSTDPDTIVAALTPALHQAFGQDPGRMPLQAIVFSARRR